MVLLRKVKRIIVVRTSKLALFRVLKPETKRKFVVIDFGGMDWWIVMPVVC